MYTILRLKISCQFGARLTCAERRLMPFSAAAPRRADSRTFSKYFGLLFRSYREAQVFRFLTKFSQHKQVLVRIPPDFRFERAILSLGRLLD